MKKLGEQWVEEMEDGKHMVKCFERHSKMTYDCSGCFYNDHVGKCLYGQDCPICDVEHGYIKDLGIVRDGVLPCPWNKDKYPTVYSVGDGVEYEIEWFVESDNVTTHSKAYGKTRQQAIDAWNRRV